jgi:hypothetical protein
MKQIELTQGMWAQVDDEDYDRLVRYCWCAHSNCHGKWYAIRIAPGPDRKIIPMSNEALATFGIMIDHHDGDGLNNQKANLRTANHAENSRNRVKKPSSGSSKFKGVYFEQSRSKWIAQIVKNGRRKFLGRFETESDAGATYNDAYDLSKIRNQ